jgi:hypothetical protein
MFQIIPESEGKIIGLRDTGKLTDQDYQEVLIPSLEALINQHAKVWLPCFIDEEFAGLEAEALWEAAKFFLPHKDGFEKMVIVGGPKWIELIMKLFAPLMKGDVKTFPSDRPPKAWE